MAVTEGNNLPGPHPGAPAGGTAPPEWLSAVRARLDAAVPPWFEMFVPPPDPLRRSAVLMLFAAKPTTGLTLPPGTGIDVVLTLRAESLRSHAAQVSFPGGHIDPDDDGPIQAAVREAEEEVGVVPETVDVVDTLPPLYMHPRQNAVTPVLAWWRRPHPIGVVDAAEVSRVVRADLDHLLDPANRFTVTGPQGYRGPGFAVDGLFIWGFTASLLSHVAQLAGIERPWDETVEHDLPPGLFRS